MALQFHPLVRTHLSVCTHIRLRARGWAGGVEDACHSTWATIYLVGFFGARNTGRYSLLFSIQFLKLAPASLGPPFFQVRSRTSRALFPEKVEFVRGERLSGVECMYFSISYRVLLSFIPRWILRPGARVVTLWPVALFLCIIRENR